MTSIGGKGSRARNKLRRQQERKGAARARRELYASQGRAGKHKVRNLNGKVRLARDRQSHPNGEVRQCGVLALLFDSFLCQASFRWAKADHGRALLLRVFTRHWRSSC